MSAEFFDPTSALDRINHDTRLFAELVEMFLEDCPALINEVRQAVHQNDARELKRAAHLLRGAIGNFSVSTAYETAKSLESMGQTNNMQDAFVAVSTLERETSRLATALEQFVSNTALSTNRTH